MSVDRNLPFDEELNGYLESPGRLKAKHDWRSVVEYRCKRSHLLGSVVKLRDGYVLYTLRRERRRQSDPTDMVFVLPRLCKANASLPVGVGGCRCQSLRKRELGQIWDDIDRQRECRKRLCVDV